MSGEIRSGLGVTVYKPSKSHYASPPTESGKEHITSIRTTTCQSGDCYYPLTLVVPDLEGRITKGTISEARADPGSVKRGIGVLKHFPIWPQVFTLKKRGNCQEIEGVHTVQPIPLIAVCLHIKACFM